MKKIALLFALMLPFGAMANAAENQDKSYEEAMADIDWDCKLSDNSYAGSIWDEKDQSYTYRYVWEGNVICESKDTNHLCMTPLVAKTPWGYTKGEMVDNSRNNIYRICRGDRDLLPGAYKKAHELRD
ncbi:hypothetical protein LMH73_021280 [Vibrio splendidus]|nr:hypothetical protein [Vibrio splendidus]MCC4880363.1 hypothetical protein [Vibrio splendidus]